MANSNSYPQSMFLSRNKKNNVYPCKPQFYYIKVGLRGSILYRYVFVMLWVFIMPLRLCVALLMNTHNVCFVQKSAKILTPQDEKTNLLTLEANKASTQSDQSLRCPHEETLFPWLSEIRPVKTADLEMTPQTENVRKKPFLSTMM